MTRRKRNVELALRCIILDSHGPRLDDCMLGSHLQSVGLADLIQATFPFEATEQLIEIPKHILRSHESYDLWIGCAAASHHAWSDWYI